MVLTDFIMILNATAIAEHPYVSVDSNMYRVDSTLITVDNG